MAEIDEISKPKLASCQHEVCHMGRRNIYSIPPTVATAARKYTFLIFGNPIFAGKQSIVI